MTSQPNTGITGILKNTGVYRIPPKIQEFTGNTGPL